jgi:microsomal dipeptidase-like Zn-dependent dipeptidase
MILTARTAEIDPENREASHTPTRTQLAGRGLRAAFLGIVFTTLAACSSDDSGSTSDGTASIYSFANGCYSIENSDDSTFLAATASGFAFVEQATPFFMKPSGLGRYLLFDDERGYVVSDGTRLLREVELLSDIKTVDDSFVSEAEWELEVADRGSDLFRLRHYKTGAFLSDGDLVTDTQDAVRISIQPQIGCADFPEEETHSTGEVAVTELEDGSLFGFADTHSHIFTNFGFGGGGVFHGAPYHPLGIEHALLSCEMFHGEDGRSDLLGIGFNANSNLTLEDLVQIVQNGMVDDFNHHTEGYPELTDWPSAFDSATHQTQYYKWLERAYLSGMRLVVQHATTNQILCDFLVNGGIQPGRYSCNDMIAVDRQIEETYGMQDYIDAQEGGPGEGWFRIVTSPAEAREVIRSGKMAVILGIEVSNPFNCFLTPPAGIEACSEGDVVERLNEYYDRGVRALFPVHKYDNAFSAGDGHKAIIEIGNILQSGHFSNFTTECDTSVNTVFDRGPLVFPGFNEPRDDFFAPPPFDFTDFFVDPLSVLTPLLPRFLVPPVPGVENHCQVAGMTPLGDFLIEQVMHKGMILEIDHFPRKSYKRAFEMMEANDYPAAGTHGLDNNGSLYVLGGISKAGFGRCRAADREATMDDGFQTKLDRIVENGGYPGLGFGFDLNGLAGAPGPRFGEKSGCSTPQTDPVTYPFTSYAGDVTFLQPKVGNRTLDFNTEGMAHIGLVAELIEDVRRDGVSDEELAPLFKSAEAYIRMWEKAERRGSELRQAATM